MGKAGNFPRFLPSRNKVAPSRFVESQSIPRRVARILALGPELRLNCPMSLQIRPAVATDTPLILQLIHELADYERLSHEVVATEATLHASLFPPAGLAPAAHCLVAFAADQPAGFALYFHNFSTFLAKPGLHLEDLFVRPAFRGQGIGRELLLHLARLANASGCGRMEWSVLDWNQPAIDFYQKLGAVPMKEWTVFRLTGAALEQYR